MDYRRIKAIEQKNMARILAACATADERSGIYIMTREENGFKYAYIGQSVNVLKRLADHLKGYQHIDLSLKKHGLWSMENPTGWSINCKYFPEPCLDEMEQRYILDFASKGYQLRNKTAGGQGNGKFGIGENKPGKGYRDGLKQGFEKARKLIQGLFADNLIYAMNGEKTVKKMNSLKKFSEFLEGEIKDE